ncbi:MAG: hypothetical protein HY323_14480 [Betaproteobacteria bacterium]|nr:hypothetical protein [Betaproteobacteria bacterium]
MMRQWLVRLGLWLARRGGWTVPVCSRLHVPEAALMEAAAPLVAWAETTFPGTSGEHKRHQVYARLLRAHPDAPRHVVALAIELALTRLRA